MPEENKEGENGEEQPDQITQEPAAKKTVKKAKPQKMNVPKEDDLKYIFYFYRPQLVESLWKWELEEGDNAAELRKPVQKVFAAGHYCYAISGDNVYSWGLGENYVLGNREDEN